MLIKSIAKLCIQNVIHVYYLYQYVFYSLYLNLVRFYESLMVVRILTLIVYGGGAPFSIFVLIAYIRTILTLL